ncbi:MAG: IS5 family transposase [Rhodospirillales bacterium]
MRGQDRASGRLFSYVSIEDRIPAGHPLRTVRSVVNDVLASLSLDFEAVYSSLGRPSIPPEQLLRALLLQAFYTVRSERRLMEQINFNMLFRWFVGLDMDGPVWDASTFCKNRGRFLESDVSVKLLNGVVTHKKVSRLLSREHFSVDGTLVEAWASAKSFRPKDGGGPGGGRAGGRNEERNFRSEKRSNETHASTTDSDARLYRKGAGKESRLCYLGHALMENRQGLAGRRRCHPGHRRGGARGRA